MKIEQIKKYERVKDEIVGLKDTFGPLLERVDIEEYAKKISEYACVYILRKEKITYGLVAIYMNDRINKTAYITLIGIAKKYRRMHLGSLLMNYCIEEARASGMKALKLEVDKKNSAAIAFYEKEGLKILGEGSDSSYYMKKVII